LMRALWLETVALTAAGYKSRFELKN
jgi:hypothetical protein